MKLWECDLEFDSVVSYPITEREPAPDWVQANRNGYLTPAIYSLYEITSFLTLAQIAGFETKDQRLVSGYFARLFRSLKDCLVESHELVETVAEATKLLYDPIKKARGESWDRTAHFKTRTALRLLVVDLYGSLDILSELLSITLPARIPNVQTGKASFSAVVSWLKREPVHTALGVVEPSVHFAELLREKLRTLVIIESAPNREWFELLRLYRHKLVHLGPRSFQTLGFKSLADETFAHFLPNSWPFVPEEDMTLATESDEGTQDFDPLKRLVNQDTVEYVRGSLSAVKAVLDAGFNVMVDIRRTVGRPPTGESAFQIRKNTEAFEFSHYPVPDEES